MTRERRRASHLFTQFRGFSRGNHVIAVLNSGSRRDSGEIATLAEQNWKARLAFSYYKMALDWIEKWEVREKTGSVIAERSRYWLARGEFSIKLSVISNLLKKKKLYNTLSQDLILLRTSVPSTLILDGWKIFFYTRLQIKEVGIRKRIRIVILWVIVFCLINKIVFKLNPILFN